MSTMALPVPAQRIKARLDTFHYFSQLPLEIQRMIWGFAARDYKNGAHFVASTCYPEENEFLDEFSASSYMYDANREFGYYLVAPKAPDIPGSVRDWVAGNPSSYIQDSGLWTACFESRDVMKRRYMKLNDNLMVQVKKTSNNENSDNENTDNENATAVKSNRAGPAWFSLPFTNSNFTHKKETWYFKVCPAEDLFCIQPLDFTAIWNVPFFELPDRIHSASWNRFKNIALEYDPAWVNTPASVDLPLNMENSVRGCFIRTLWSLARQYESDGLTLWLIDRTIRKRNNPVSIYMPDYSDDDDDDDKVKTGGKTEPKVFYGNDRRYVEVKDLKECVYNVIGENTAFHFLHWLQEKAGFNVQWMMNQRTNPAITSVPNSLSDLVKVLCEERT